MRIGFYVKWKIGSLDSKTNVIGDELFGNSMCKAMKEKDGVESCELYASNNIPKEKLDVMIYLNDTNPNKNWAKKHVLYLQNGYGDGSDVTLKKLQQFNYDGYAFVSNRLLSIHKNDGFDGIFLPFGVDTELFYPHPLLPKYKFDVAYVGNDIKGLHRTNKYLLPATQFNFRLFGNWEIPHSKFLLWRNWKKRPAYRKLFAKISSGRIPQEEVPKLYSSAKINLNCTMQDCVDWDVITLRTYEVLACKGFLISDKVYIDEETIYDCAVFTDGNNDLTRKIEYYLNHENERQKIAQKGYEFVRKNATIEARMDELLKYIETIL